MALDMYNNGLPVAYRESLSLTYFRLFMAKQNEKAFQPAGLAMDAKQFCTDARCIIAFAGNATQHCIIRLPWRFFRK